MSTHSLRFANKLWVDYLFKRESFRKTAIKLTIFSMVPWFFGLTIAFTIDRMAEYISTPIFYFGSIGIFLTIGSLIYGSRTQYTMYNRFLSCYTVTEKEKKEIIGNALARHSNFFQHARASVVVFLVGLIFASGGMLWWTQTSSLSNLVSTNLPRFYALEKYGWYDTAITTESFCIVLGFVLFISFPLGTSGSIMLRLPVFLWRESSRPPKYPPSLIKAHFSLATTFYSRVSILWILGVLLLFYLIGPNADWLSFTIVILLFLLGVVNFAIPQVTYVRTVSASEDKYLDLISERFQQSTFNGDGGEIMPMIQLMRHDDWVYPVHQTFIVVGVYAISLYNTIFGWDLLVNLIKTTVR